MLGLAFSKCGQHNSGTRCDPRCSLSQIMSVHLSAHRGQARHGGLTPPPPRGPVGQVLLGSPPQGLPSLPGLRQLPGLGPGPIHSSHSKEMFLELTLGHDSPPTPWPKCAHFTHRCDNSVWSLSSQCSSTHVHLTYTCFSLNFRLKSPLHCRAFSSSHSNPQPALPSN